MFGCLLGHNWKKYGSVYKRTVVASERGYVLNTWTFKKQDYFCNKCAEYKSVAISSIFEDHGLNTRKYI